MRMMASNHGSLRRVFREGFSAQDIAQPLLSFDGTASCQRVKTIMSDKGLDVVGIRTDGIVAGFVEIVDLTGSSCADVARSFDASRVVSDTVPLAPLVLHLKDQPRLFVMSLGQHLHNEDSEQRRQSIHRRIGQRRHLRFVTRSNSSARKFVD